MLQLWDLTRLMLLWSHTNFVGALTTLKWTSHIATCAWSIENNFISKIAHDIKF